MENESFEKKSLAHFFDTNYRKLLIVSISLLVLAIIYLGFTYLKTGELINRDVTLKGGVTITLTADIDINKLTKDLSSNFKDIDVRALKSAGQQTGIIVSAGIDQQEVDSLVASIEKTIDRKLKEDEYTVEFVGSTLGMSFFKETITAIFSAFILMAIVVFIYFRLPIPSLAIILSAFSDIIVTLAFSNLIGMRLSTAGIAAFLMLIGYSVDTNILLTNRVLKRKEGSLTDRIHGAFKTGIMMTLTAIVAITVGLISTNSEVIRQIMIILLVGLVADIIFTWIQNVGILRIYLEKKGIKI